VPECWIFTARRVVVKGFALFIISSLLIVSTLVLKEIRNAERLDAVVAADFARWREEAARAQAPPEAPEAEAGLCDVLLMAPEEYGDRLIPEWALAVATIRMEADREPFDGKIAVGVTIRNRMKFRYSSDGTLAGTVLKPFAFSCFNTDHPRRGRICAAPLDDPLTEQAYRAWLASGDPGTARILGLDGRVVLYHAITMAKEPYWVDAPSVKFVKEIGHHRFYADEAGA